MVSRWYRSWKILSDKYLVWCWPERKNQLMVSGITYFGHTVGYRLPQTMLRNCLVQVKFMFEELDCAFLSCHTTSRPIPHRVVLPVVMWAGLTESWHPFLLRPLLFSSSYVPRFLPFLLWMLPLLSSSFSLVLQGLPRLARYFLPIPIPFLRERDWEFTVLIDKFILEIVWKGKQQSLRKPTTFASTPGKRADAISGNTVD